MPPDCGPVEHNGAGARRVAGRCREIALGYGWGVARLCGAAGESRVIEIARRLGVTPGPVARAIQRLQREGLVTSLPYRSICLTASGSKLSKESRTRHEIVVEFLRSLGVPALVAQSDAEGIEHHVSAETLQAFVKHLRKERRKR